VSPAAADRGVAVIERSLAKDGPLTRQQLKHPIDAAGVRTKGHALVHILMLSALRGLTVRGPIVGSDHAYVLVRDWLGEPRRVDGATALAELARRYLVGHGPADDRDLAKWAGIPLGDARAGLRAIASELDERTDGIVALPGRAISSEPAPPRLLGQYDPLLLGWVSRAPILGTHSSPIVEGGSFRPFALVRGRAVGRWKISDGRVALSPFSRLKRADRVALEADAADVVRFLDLPTREDAGSSRRCETIAFPVSRDRDRLPAHIFLIELRRLGDLVERSPGERVYPDVIRGGVEVRPGRA
jgi:hypothetical protein